MQGLNTKNIGDVGENIATEYLKGLGYKILDRNVYFNHNELDIVALDGNTIVFVEVKARANNCFGNPVEAVTQAKVKSIVKCAKMYIKSKLLYERDIRFDIIGIDGSEIQHIKDAFWAN